MTGSVVEDGIFQLVMALRAEKISAGMSPLQAQQEVASLLERTAQSLRTLPEEQPAHE